MGIGGAAPSRSPFLSALPLGQPDLPAGERSSPAHLDSYKAWRASKAAKRSESKWGPNEVLLRLKPTRWKVRSSAIWSAVAYR